jgi:hypothetical protein
VLDASIAMTVTGFRVDTGEKPVPNTSRQHFPAKEPPREYRPRDCPLSGFFIVKNREVLQELDVLLRLARREIHFLH